MVKIRRLFFIAILLLSHLGNAKFNNELPLLLSETQIPDIHSTRGGIVEKMTCEIDDEPTYLTDYQQCAEKLCEGFNRVSPYQDLQEENLDALKKLRDSKLKDLKTVLVDFSKNIFPVLFRAHGEILKGENSLIKSNIVLSNEDKEHFLRTLFADQVKSELESKSHQAPDRFSQEEKINNIRSEILRDFDGDLTEVERVLLTQYALGIAPEESLLSIKQLPDYAIIMKEVKSQYANRSNELENTKAIKRYKNIINTTFDYIQIEVPKTEEEFIEGLSALNLYLIYLSDKSDNVNSKIKKLSENLDWNEFILTQKNKRKRFLEEFKIEMRQVAEKGIESLLTPEVLITFNTCNSNHINNIASLPSDQQLDDFKRKVGELKTKLLKLVYEKLPKETAENLEPRINKFQPLYPLTKETYIDKYNNILNEIVENIPKITDFNIPNDESDVNRFLLSSAYSLYLPSLFFNSLVTQLCKMNTENFEFNGSVQPWTNHQEILPTSVKYPDVGLSTVAHEFGHQLSNLLGYLPNKSLSKKWIEVEKSDGSKEKMDKIRQCLVEQYPLDYLHDTNVLNSSNDYEFTVETVNSFPLIEEDFADMIRALLGTYPLRYCQVLELSNYSDEGALIPIREDVHSGLLFRLLHSYAILDENNKIPESCNSYFQKTKKEFKFQDCSKK